MVILGGAGSQAGVVIGAIGISVLLELLREPGDSRFLFYALVLLGLVAALRFSRRLAIVLGGTLVFGFVVHAVAEAIDESWTSGVPRRRRAARRRGRTNGWSCPSDLAAWMTPVSYIGLVAAILTLTLLQGRWRDSSLLVPDASTWRRSSGRT